VPRPGLRIHIIGPHGDMIDEHDDFRDAYAPAIGDWILVRPDGYIGAMVAADKVDALEHYLAHAGLPAVPQR